MAKKVAITRVHQLAKRLCVGSKDIVAKCESEGIPDIINHMSAVSAGLAATISEWFSEGKESTTAIETAEKVDITKVKAKAKKKTAKKAAPNPQNSQSIRVTLSWDNRPSIPVAVGWFL